MDVQRLLKVREAIIAEPQKFNIHIFRGNRGPRECDTVYCIGGMTVNLFVTDTIGAEYIPSIARELLDINREQSDFLFYGGVTKEHQPNMSDLSERLWCDTVIGSPDHAIAGARWIDAFVRDFGTREEQLMYKHGHPNFRV